MHIHAPFTTLVFSAEGEELGVFLHGDPVDDVPVPATKDIRGPLLRLLQFATVIRTPETHPFPWLPQGMEMGM